MRLDKKIEALQLIEKCVAFQTETLGNNPRDTVILKVISASRACNWTPVNVLACIDLSMHAIINKYWSFVLSSMGSRLYPRGLST